MRSPLPLNRICRACHTLFRSVGMNWLFSCKIATRLVWVSSVSSLFRKLEKPVFCDLIFSSMIPLTSLMSPNFNRFVSGSLLFSSASVLLDLDKHILWIGMIDCLLYKCWHFCHFNKIALFLELQNKTRLVYKNSLEKTFQLFFIVLAQLIETRKFFRRLIPSKS